MQLHCAVSNLGSQDPLRCEPGMETATDEKVELANVFVVHESIRVGACAPVPGSLVVLASLLLQGLFYS